MCKSTSLISLILFDKRMLSCPMTLLITGMNDLWLRYSQSQLPQSSSKLLPFDEIFKKFYEAVAPYPRWGAYSAPSPPGRRTRLLFVSLIRNRLRLATLKNVEPALISDLLYGCFLQDLAKQYHSAFIWQFCLIMYEKKSLTLIYGFGAKTIKLASLSLITAVWSKMCKKQSTCLDMDVISQNIKCMYL